MLEYSYSLVKKYVYAKEPPYIEPIEVKANDSDGTIAARIAESRRKAYYKKYNHNCFFSPVNCRVRPLKKAHRLGIWAKNL